MTKMHHLPNGPTPSMGHTGDYIPLDEAVALVATATFSGDVNAAAKAIRVAAREGRIEGLGGDEERRYYGPIPCGEWHRLLTRKGSVLAESDDDFLEWPDTIVWDHVVLPRAKVLELCSIDRAQPNLNISKAVPSPQQAFLEEPKRSGPKEGNSPTGKVRINLQSAIDEGWLSIAELKVMPLKIRKQKFGTIKMINSTGKIISVEVSDKICDDARNKVLSDPRNA